MFLDETKQQNGAASQNDAPGDASIAGAASQPSSAVEAVAKAADAVVEQSAPAAQSAPSRQVIVVTPEVQDVIKSLLEAADCEALVTAKATQICEQSKAETILRVNMLLKPILDWFNAKKSEPAPIAAAAAGALAAGVVGVGSRVKVWQDAEHKTFLTGVVREVHDGGHSFDVELSGGLGTHVQADGLELDELAQ